jgi:hypothetical protein
MTIAWEGCDVQQRPMCCAEQRDLVPTHGRRADGGGNNRGEIGLDVAVVFQHHRRVERGIEDMAGREQVAGIGAGVTGIHFRGRKLILQISGYGAAEDAGDPLE